MTGDRVLTFAKTSVFLTSRKCCLSIGWFGDVSDLCKEFQQVFLEQPQGLMAELLPEDFQVTLHVKMVEIIL